MRIESIELTNFRCFKKLRLDLSTTENVAVLVAENGQGKSSVLDALRIALWSFVSGFDLARNSYNDPGNSITINDVRLISLPQSDMARQLPSSIDVVAQFNDGTQHGWKRYRESEKKGTKTRDDARAKQVRLRSEEIQNYIRSPENSSITLPVIGYYGTGRLWAQKRLTEGSRGKDDTLGKDFYIRTFAYMNCLDPASTYKHFKEWFTWAFEAYREQAITFLENSQPTPASFPEQDRILAVQRAIDALLRGPTGWHRLEYSIRHAKALVMHHDTLGTLDVETLSDGIRSVLAMVGDIAYRCVKLNPHLGANAARETSGVILIDEIDMHLHPRWQQVIVNQLKGAFPNIQFIVTTHSPQVLSALRKECIWVIYEDGQQLNVEQPANSPLAHEAGYALAEIMGTQTIPDTPEIQKWVESYQQYVRNGQESAPEAVEFLRNLEQKGYQIHASDLALWRLIASQRHRIKATEEPH